MGKKSKAPPPPDYAALAKQQAELSKTAAQEQTQANRPNQVTPWGTTSWSQDAGGNWTQTQTLTPEAQAALDSQMAGQQALSKTGQGMLGRIDEAYAKPFSFAGAPEMKALQGGWQDYGKRAEDALYSGFEAKAAPRFERQRKAEDARLAAMGFNLEDRGARTVRGDTQQAQNEAYQQAAREAIQFGGAEAQRALGMDISAGEYGNKNRQQWITEALMQRNQPLNEYTALMSGQKVGAPNMPSFQSGTPYMPENVYGAASDTFNAQQARQAQRNQGFGSILQAGASALPFFLSDRRVKKVIGRIGSTAKGTPLYLYIKDGRRQVGVIAQECPPHAVRERADGLLEVNYAEV